MLVTYEGHLQAIEAVLRPCTSLSLIRYQSTRIRFYLLKAGRQVGDEPLPPCAPGRLRWFSGSCW